MKKYLSVLLFFVLATNVQAQRHEILSPRIASLQVMAGNHWMDMPVAEIGGNIHIDFDDLTHEYTRYTYRHHRRLHRVDQYLPAIHPLLADHPQRTLPPEDER